MTPGTALDKSAAMILPPGPDPLPMDVKSRPCSLPSLLANGEANSLPPTPPDAGRGTPPDAGWGTPLDAGWGTLPAGTGADFAGAGGEGGAAGSFPLTAIGPLGAT